MKYNPFGGYERQAALLARALVDRGVGVTVFTSDWKGPKPEGMTVRKVPIVRFASWLKVLSFALFSRRALRGGGEFDAVIAFDRTLVMDIYRAGNACHREWQATRRRFGGMRDRVSMAVNPLNMVINAIEKRIFATVDSSGGAIVVLSGAGAEQIRRHYPVDPERFVAIPPTVDLARLEGKGTDRDGARKAFGVTPGRVVLLHVGSGFRIKGLESTVRALALLAKDEIDCELLVAGRDRSGIRRYGELAGSLGVGDRVRFLGGVEDMAALYAAADVFVLPSVFETFGVAVVEALYMGLPVVVGRGAGVSELVEGEGVGSVVDVPADPSELAGVISRAWAREEGLRGSGGLDGERARRRAATSACSVGSVMESYMSLIGRVAGTGTVGG